MLHGFARRVEQLEDALVVGEDRQKFERQLRHNYNLMSVSNEALHESIGALQQRKHPPDWAEAEFQKPIPPDAPQWLVREAEQKARNDMRLS